MTGSPSIRRRGLLTDGRFALLAGLTLLVILGIGLTPTILREQTRDWIAYEQAASRLVAGGPLYVFQLPTPDDEYYLYPPLGAAIWAAVGSPEGLLALKVLALLSVGLMATRVTSSARPIERSFVAIALAAAALFAPPDFHDLVLGNVMALYVGAVAISLARPGWLGSIPLGLVCALALKPVIAPYFIWLAIRRRTDLLRIIAVGLVASAICAAVVGPGRYIEYVLALPRLSVLVDWKSGNVGLGSIFREAAVVGVAMAYIVTFVGSRRLDPARGAAVAVAAGLLAQPTIGFDYAGLLLPAVVMLWAGDRVAGLVACVVVPLATIISPPLGAVVLMALAFSGIGDRATAKEGAGLPATVPV